MSDLLTTKQLQEILRVDRTTIYRMADAGRLPGIKVGNQWRFSRPQIEAWLQQAAGTFASAHEVVPVPPAASGKPPLQGPLREPLKGRDIFPHACVQLIQDCFAEMLGVMILVVDLNGQPITHVSNPCGLFLAAEESPVAHRRCVETWNRLAQEPALTPRYERSHLGLLCARGLIRAGSEMGAMLVVGGLAPGEWPPPLAERQRIADELGLDLAQIEAHLHEVHHLNAADQAKALSYVQRIADIFAHIATERCQIFDRLQRIAAITQM